MSLPFAAYVRVSRVGDRRDTLVSPELQLERIRSYARTHAYELAVLDPELDVSGAKFHRPVLDRILSGIEAGEFCGLIVSQQDRLSRMGVLDTLRLIDRIESLGGTFISCAENIDGSTRSGKLTRNLFSSIAEHELDRYREQFRESKERAVKAGVWPSPKVPRGYKRGEGRKLVREQGVDRLVVRAFEARAAGAAWSEVAHLLGTPISTATKIIHNRVYLGEVRSGQFVNRKAHTAIVDRGLWEAAQRRQPRGPTARNPGLLTGLIRCAGCQGRMTARERIYVCQRKPRVGGRCEEPAAISRRRVEDFVEGVVRSYVDGVKVKARERTTDLEDAQASLGEAESELVTYQEITRVSDLPADSFLAGMRSRIGAVEEARRRLASLRVETPVSPDFVWEKFSVAQRRQLLRGFLGVCWCKRKAGVRVIARGYEPEFPRLAPVVPLDWEADLPGEIGVLLP